MKIWRWIVQALEGFARARAAAELSRQGNYQAARNIYHGHTD